MKIRTLHDLEEAREAGLRSLYPARLRIAVGMATCGLATGAGEVYDALCKAIAAHGLPAIVTRVGCLGFCQMEPLVDVLMPGRPRVLYAEMTPERTTALVAALAQNRLPATNALARMTAEEYILENRWHSYPLDGGADELSEVPLYQELPFFAQQKRIVLRNCGLINPEHIEEYIARGGISPSTRPCTS